MTLHLICQVVLFDIDTIFAPKERVEKMRKKIQKGNKHVSSMNGHKVFDILIGSDIQCTSMHPICFFSGVVFIWHLKYGIDQNRKHGND